MQGLDKTGEDGVVPITLKFQGVCATTPSAFAAGLCVGHKANQAAAVKKQINDRISFEIVL